MAKQTKDTRIEAITHEGETRTNIPTAELENLVREEEARPQKIKYPRKNNPNETPELYARNKDLDPQLVWKGKDDEDKKPLSVDAVPIYVQEQIQPKAIIDEIKRQSKKAKIDNGEETPDLFADWVQELDPKDKIEFYQHAQKWTNRIILGDSLQVMTSLSEKESLKGQVQCIYFDPPYGINFSSNWQKSTDSMNVSEKDFSSEPEAIKAFRDTWEHGINSYLSYLRDRLYLCRDLLTESGSIFLQIGEENMHRVKLLMDEIFGAENYVTTINFRKKTMPLGSNFLEQMSDFIIWFSKDKNSSKYRNLYRDYDVSGLQDWKWVEEDDGTRRQITKEEHSDNKLIKNNARVFRLKHPSPIGNSENKKFAVNFEGKKYQAPGNGWGMDESKLANLIAAGRVQPKGNTLNYILFHSDSPVTKMTNPWLDTSGPQNKTYVVQTSDEVIKRCILMTTEPGDLVLDPTCGSGATANVAEAWGRRWITIDTSRVAVALARQRIMAASYPYFKINSKDSIGDVKKGFLLKTAPHITLKSIAENELIANISERYQLAIDKQLSKLNEDCHEAWKIWTLPKVPTNNFTPHALESLKEIRRLQKEKKDKINHEIRTNAAFVELVDSPIIERGVLRVSGPFSMESLSPHRIVPTDAEDEVLLDQLASEAAEKGHELSQPKSKRLRPKSVEEGETRFLDVVQENLAKAGVQNTKKGERLEFLALDIWPSGRYIQLEGRYTENGRDKKAAICVGPEYGTVTRSLMVQAAREAADYFDILVVLGFAFEAHADEDLLNIGRLTVLRARMNNDLHMADRLKSGKSGNLFVVFGEPDIELRKSEKNKLEVEIKGVDIFDPTTGDVKASGPDDIACWFIDTDYNDEAFFVRHAYFSGGGSDPFKRLKTTLKAEINEDAWASLYSTISRPFDMPSTGRIAVKAINHYGDEALKVFDV